MEALITCQKISFEKLYGQLHFIVLPIKSAFKYILPVCLWSLWESSLSFLPLKFILTYRKKLLSKICTKTKLRKLMKWFNIDKQTCFIASDRNRNGSLVLTSYVKCFMRS